MHDVAGLSAAFDQIIGLSYPERNVFRCVELIALIGDGTRTVQSLFDLGPRLSGQRYTPVGGARALYVSEHPSTSYIEATGMFASVAALAQQNAPAEVQLQFRTRLESILDITLPGNQALLDTNSTELALSWQWQMAMGKTVPTQILGELAFTSGKFQAIRFPSSRNAEAINLVIFTERVVAPSF
ncbi:hypothetical protein BH11CYA1_BH11CYA1_44020 [soil metagenome]